MSLSHHLVCHRQHQCVARMMELQVREAEERPTTHRQCAPAQAAVAHTLRCVTDSATPEEATRESTSITDDGFQHLTVLTASSSAACQRHRGRTCQDCAHGALGAAAARWIARVRVYCVPAGWQRRSLRTRSWRLLGHDRRRLRPAWRRASVPQYADAAMRPATHHCWAFADRVAHAAPPAAAHHRMQWGAAFLVPLCKSLRRLHLICCSELTDRGLASISTLTQLEALDVGACWGVTDAGLLVLAASLRRLQRLRLACCAKVSNNGLLHLATIEALEQVHVTGASQVTGNIDIGTKIICVVC
ncbi:receptor-type protein kinase, putative [Bodo saltans]|uniref:Receptor-type protein kinase, putative n=1 Tax=Bodo saltans TaxID=75058 RepID=A0A0S4J2D2_BODSA|nr:receptor-type protein kinase, putative [Bodo saltans]|eukprot:CUG20266.1 receptor-type protein kinase, putative [Bodo saltans]